MPKVTIALITYDRPDYLGEAIKGAINQSFKDFELLIMDNGSDISTRQMIDSFDDPRIVYNRNPENSRNYINEAFYLAKGKYLLITHDDDVMMPDMLKKQVKILENDHDVIAVACNMSDIDQNGKILKKVTHNLKKDLIFKKEQFISFYLRKGISLTCPTVLMHLSKFREHNLKYDPSVGPAADVYLWFMVNLLPNTIYFISEPLYSYRVHPNQDSTLNKLSMEIRLFNGLKTLLIDQKLRHYIVLLKRLKMDNIMGILTQYYINNLINEDDFISRIASLKQDGLTVYDSKKSAFRWFIFRISPALYKKIFSFYAAKRGF